MQFNILLLDNVGAPVYPNNALVKRKFYITNIQQPAGLFANGIRAWVVELMRARNVEGSVKRTLYDGYQSLLLNVTGSIETLAEVRRFLTYDTSTFENETSRPWDVVVYGDDVHVSNFSHHKFTIVASDRGAESGPGSDSAHDYKSVGSGSTKSNASGTNLHRKT